MNAFVCLPHDGARLSRSACARRHESAAVAYGPQHLRTGKVWSEQCSSCELGKAHVRGERPTLWPGGVIPIVEVNLIPASSLLRSTPARRKEKKATRVGAPAF